MADSIEALSVALFSEIFMADQLARNRLSRALPNGMELSQFSLLNHLASASAEKSPAQLAKAFHVTRGAMTNTLAKLERAGYIQVRPDLQDARRKFIVISLTGRTARDAAMKAITPITADVVDTVGADKVRSALPVLRAVRARLADD